MKVISSACCVRTWRQISGIRAGLSACLHTHCGLILTMHTPDSGFYEEQTSSLTDHLAHAFTSSLHDSSSLTLPLYSIPNKTKSQHDDAIETNPPTLVPLPDSLDKKLYGKWRYLIEDNVISWIEVDGQSQPSVVMPIDNHDWKDDITLWACLVDVMSRWRKREGVLKVLRLFLDHQPDLQLDGPLADFFWGSITAVALDDMATFDDLYQNAQEHYKARGTKWPRLYATVMSYLLQNKLWTQAVEWHQKLYPENGPEDSQFVDLICRFAGTSNATCHSALQSIYSHSSYRDLYDKIIPRLHRRGLYSTTLQWRSVLLMYHDRPRSSLSGPFIRYLQRHFPEESLCKEELIVSHPDFGKWSNVPRTTHEIVTMAHSGFLSHRGDEPLKDHTVARFLASDWLGLDLVVSVIHNLGVQQLGSLSLQALGLRCKTSQELADRLDELKVLGIKLPDDKYTLVVFEMVRQSDDANLFTILNSDVHPDVFCDVKTLRKIANSSAKESDWQMQRAFSAVIGILSKDQASDIYVMALKRTFKNPKYWSHSLRLIHDANLSQVFFPRSVFTTFIKALKFDLMKRSSLGFRSNTAEALNLAYIALERDCTLPTWIWTSMLCTLVRDRRFELAEGLGRHLLDYFRTISSKGQNVRLHPSDALFRNQAALVKGHKTTLPGKTSFSNTHHPCRHIFNEKLVVESLVAGFRSPLSHGTSDRNALNMDPSSKRDFGPAIGVRFLRILKDLGAPISEDFVSVALVYATLDWRPKPWRMNYGRLLTTAWRSYSIEEVKYLCDEAWGSTITPPLKAFETAIQETRSRAIETQRQSKTEHTEMLKATFQTQKALGDYFRQKYNMMNSTIKAQETEFRYSY